MGYEQITLRALVFVRTRDGETEGSDLLAVPHRRGEVRA
jgi:hypothetical protein